MQIERAKADISIYRGDTPKYNYQLINIDDETGEEVNVDITNATISGQVRYDTDSPEVWFTLPITKTSPELGIFQWKLTKQQSEELLPVGSIEPNSAIYDIQIELNGAVFTFLYGSFTITRDITRI